MAVGYEPLHLDSSLPRLHSYTDSSVLVTGPYLSNIKLPPAAFLFFPNGIESVDFRW